MKKRLISLVLCAMLLATPFFMSGCNRARLEGDPDAPAAETVVMAIVGEDIDEDALRVVESRMNHLLENLYQTRLHIIVFTPEEYIEEIATRSIAQHANVTASPPLFGIQRPLEDMAFDRDNPPDSIMRRANGDWVYTDATGRQQTLFPAVRENQIDIILINGVETYNALKFGGFTTSVYNQDGNVVVVSNISEFEDGETVRQVITPILQPLSELIRFRRELVRNINTAMFERANHVDVPNIFGQSEVFAIPNNFMPDNAEFYFMLVNRELMHEFQYDINTVSSILDLEFFLEDVISKAPDVIPVYNFLGYNFFVPDERLGPNPLITIPFALNSAGGRILTPMAPRQSFTTASYRNILNLFHNIYQLSGHRVENIEVDLTQDFAVAFVRGIDLLRSELEEDYYVITISPPIVDSSMFDSMFAISYSSTEIASYRAMQIIEALSTNSDLVNLFAFGIQGEHYTLNANGVVTNRRGGYNMNPRFAGNNFLLRQHEGMCESMLYFSANNWHAATRMAQTFLISPYAGFQILDLGYVNVRANGETTDEAPPMTLDELFAGLNALSEEVYDRIRNFDLETADFSSITNEQVTARNLSIYIQHVIQPELAANPYIQAFTLVRYVNSPAAQYRAFFERMFQIPVGD